MRHVRYAIQLDFERDCYLLFHFLCRVSRPLGDDLRVGVGNVWVGFNGQIVEGNDSPDKKHHRHTQNQNAVAQSKVDQVADHLPCSATLDENASALAISSSPAFTPTCICCVPSALVPPV